VTTAASNPVLPRHIAITMDGNGRWAAARGLARSAGHKAGLAPVRLCIEECARRGVEALTLFAFSSENWSRPLVEVASLMDLFVDALDTLHIGHLAYTGDHGEWPFQHANHLAKGDLGHVLLPAAEGVQHEEGLVRDALIALPPGVQLVEPRQDGVAHGCPGPDRVRVFPA
jgi:hypothetical protein